MAEWILARYKWAHAEMIVRDEQRAKMEGKLFHVRPALDRKCKSPGCNEMMFEINGDDVREIFPNFPKDQIALLCGRECILER